jgi:hypothetical protein
MLSSHKYGIMQNMTDGKVSIKSHCGEKEALSEAHGKEKKYNWKKQQVKEMALVFERKLISEFGTVELTYQISRKAKFPSKMSMGCGGAGPSTQPRQSLHFL